MSSLSCSFRDFFELLDSLGVLIVNFCEILVSNLCCRGLSILLHLSELIFGEYFIFFPFAEYLYCNLTGFSIKNYLFELFEFRALLVANFPGIWSVLEPVLSDKSILFRVSLAWFELLLLLRVSVSWLSKGVHWALKSTEWAFLFLLLLFSTFERFDKLWETLFGVITLRVFVGDKSLLSFFCILLLGFWWWGERLSV